jgi:isoleucyl-tRNA synthetase
LIREELNVKQVEFVPRADQYITYTILPDLKLLGPKLGKRLPELRKVLAAADAAKLMAELESLGKVSLALADGSVELDSKELQVRLQAKEGWAAAHGPAAVVVLSTELTPELVTEGWARELVHAIQNQRKDLGCEYTDRIAVGIDSESEEIRRASVDFRNYICAETLAFELQSSAIAGVEAVEISVAGAKLRLYVKRLLNTGEGPKA